MWGIDNRVKMLVDNANHTGAAIEVGSSSAKQHLIPALKGWKMAHSEMTVVDVNFDYDMWGEAEYMSAFGNNLLCYKFWHIIMRCPRHLHPALPPPAPLQQLPL